MKTKLKNPVMFPLIPLPIKEAVAALVNAHKDLLIVKFPLIPLPIKEAVIF